MSETEPRTIRAAELRRRVRAAEQLRLKTCELAAADVLHRHKAAQDAARAKKRADTEAGEAVAAALRLFGDAELVAELTELPAHVLNRSAKTVTASRAAEIVEDLQVRASQPRRPRQRANEAAAEPANHHEPTLADDASTPEAIR